MLPSDELTERLALYTCNDCGANVVTIGEFYLLNPKIWSDQLGLGWDDNLCIGCLEARMGRRMRRADIITFPRYPWMKPMSIRLQHRLFGFGVTKRPPYRWRKSFLKYHGGFTKALAKTIGEYAEREAR